MTTRKEGAELEPNTLSPAETACADMSDIIDRIRACEKRSLVTIDEESVCRVRDADAWVELWKTLRDAANVIKFLRAEVRKQLNEIAALLEDRRALLGADAPPTWRNERADGGWISAKERLPPKHVEVIAHWITPKSVPIVESAVLRDDGWFSMCGQPLGLHGAKNWMPLPEPPEV